MKKIKYVLLVFTIMALLPLTAFAKEKVNVYLFKREGCAYCANALTFFTNLSKDEEYQNYFTLVTKDVSNKNHASLMEKTAKYFNVDLKGVPFIVIGEQHFEGYASTFDEQLKIAIKNTYENEIKDVVLSLTNEKDSNDAAITIIILLAIISGIAFLIYMAKENQEVEEQEPLKKEKIVPTKKEQAKKVVNSTANKKVDSKKKTATNQTKKSTSIKSTTTKKKTPTKKNTTKKTTNKK